MSDISINISHVKDFGSFGTSNGQFQYPSGIIILNNEIFVVDRQNHRIQVFGLDGLFLRNFGSEGSLNNQFYFPDGITSDGTNLFIADSGNHRIKIHNTSGVFIGAFGTMGTLDNEFQYPVGITNDGTNLFIADKQNHRIKVHSFTGTFIYSFGTEGAGNNNFYFPEGLDIVNGNLIVVDSGNKKVKSYTKEGVYLNTIQNVSFGYPISVANIANGVFMIIDKTRNEISFFDNTNKLIIKYGSSGSGVAQFYFPLDAFYQDGKMYITDSANFRVKILNTVVNFEIPFYKDVLIRLTKQLYPTGRAWWLNYKNVFYTLHEGLSFSESRAIGDSDKALNAILPDNDNFTTEDAFNWESALGLLSNSNLDLSIRKESILRKMKHPGNIPARQHYLYLEYQLQLAGFDVYVHENRFETIIPYEYEVIDPDTLNLSLTQLNNAQVGSAMLGGGSGLATYDLIGNYIDKDKENISFDTITSGDQIGSSQVGSTMVGSDISITREEFLRGTIFIGGKNFPDPAQVSSEREKEFRELILKVKPVQIVGFLFINYI